MCNTTITSIIDQIISFAISEGTSTVSEIIGKQRRQKALQESISSRTNGYIQHPLGNDEFKKYNLARITSEERNAYLEKLNINAIEFNRQIHDNGLYDMIESVFNFIELVRLWQADGRLPNETVAMDT